MRIVFAIYCIFISAFSSCKFLPSADKRYDPGQSYRLRLNPEVGSKYYFDISTKSELKVESDDKKVKNTNTATVGMQMNISKDSTGNFVFGMQYDKIHIVSDNGNEEREMDAANAALSIDPAEKMLGQMKSLLFTATISPVGEVKAVSGYKELGAKFMEDLDPAARETAQKQLDQVIGEGMIKKNMQQMFTIFPDSAIHVGDKWNLYFKQQGEFGLHVKTFFRLKEINEGFAIIESHGEMVSDSASTDVLGYDATSNLKGTLKGTYEMETSTGMLMKSEISSELQGTIIMAGREIPITIESNVKMSGKKIK